MKCPNPKCNFENQANSKFCSQCGSPLVGMCPICGFLHIPEHANFCPECGFKLYDGEVVLISVPHHKTASTIDNSILNHVVNRFDLSTFIHVKKRNQSIANLLLSLQTPTSLILSVLQYRKTI